MRHAIVISERLIGPSGPLLRVDPPKPDTLGKTYSLRLEQRPNNLPIPSCAGWFGQSNHYITTRPHSALNYRPPAPEAIIPMEPRPTMH